MMSESWKVIEDLVCRHFNVTIEDMRGRSRVRDIVDARQFVWYIEHAILGYRGTHIAREYGVTTRNVFYASSVIREGIICQPFYAKHMEAIMRELKKFDLTAEGDSLRTIEDE